MAVVAKGAIIRERVVSFLFSLHSVAVVARGAIMRERVASSLFSLHSGLLCSTIFSSNSTSFSQILEHVSCSGYTRTGDR